MATRAWDLLDRRVLAALRFVDALGSAVTVPVAIRGPEGFRYFVKRPGMVVVTDAPGLANHAASFAAPPAVPAIGAITVPLDCTPASTAYGARRFALRLPRDPVPASLASLFTVIDVVLPPTPATPLTGLAAGLRVRVTRSDDGRAIEGALVRLRPGGALPQTVALTDAAGEALLLAAAVPLTSPGPGAVMLGDIAAEVDAVVNPARVLFHAPDEVFAARAASAARTRDLIDVDAVNGTVTPILATRIAAGEVRSVALGWTPP